MEPLRTIKRKSLEPFWYVWYTKPKSEKQVLDRLTSKQVVTYLPIRKELRQWSDRKKWVETPLFGGYIFTFINYKQFDEVKFTEGILSFVKFEGKPAKVKTHEIELIKRMLTGAEDIEVSDSNPFLEGDRIVISYGPFIGTEAVIVEVRGKKKLAINFEQFGKSLLLEVPKQMVVKKAVA